MCRNYGWEVTAAQAFVPLTRMIRRELFQGDANLTHTVTQFLDPEDWRSQETQTFPFIHRCFNCWERLNNLSYKVCQSCAPRVMYGALVMKKFDFVLAVHYIEALQLGGVRIKHIQLALKVLQIQAEDILYLTPRPEVELEGMSDFFRSTHSELFGKVDRSKMTCSCSFADCPHAYEISYYVNAVDMTRFVCVLKAVAVFAKCDSSRVVQVLTKKKSTKKKEEEEKGLSEDEICQILTKAQGDTSLNRKLVKQLEKICKYLKSDQTDYNVQMLKRGQRIAADLVKLME